MSPKPVETSEAAAVIPQCADDSVTLIASDGTRVPASVIHVWQRLDAYELPSEGLTFAHMARALFGQVPFATRVMLVRVGATILFLVEAAHQWYDTTATPVQVVRKRVAQSPTTFSHDAGTPTRPTPAREVAEEQTAQGGTE